MTFEAFYQTHHERILRVLGSHLPARAVEDLNADIWLRVLLYFERSRPTTQWINKVVASRIADYYRTRQDTTLLSECSEFAAVAEDVAEIVVRRERYRAVCRVLNATTPTRRAAVLHCAQETGTLTPGERVALHHFRKELAKEGITT